jgi:hypothetical protein
VDYIIRTGGISLNPALEVEIDMRLAEGETIDEGFIEEATADVSPEEERELRAEWDEFLRTGKVVN